MKLYLDWRLMGEGPDRYVYTWVAIDAEEQLEFVLSGRGARSQWDPTTPSAPGSFAAARRAPLSDVEVDELAWLAAERQAMKEIGNYQFVRIFEDAVTETVRVRAKQILDRRHVSMAKSARRYRKSPQVLSVSQRPLPPAPLPVVTGPIQPSVSWLKKVARILERDGPLCCWCGGEMEIGGNTWDRATIEHVIPKSKGGGNQLSNLKLACEWCNRHRGNGDVVPAEKLLERHNQLKNREQRQQRTEAKWRTWWHKRDRDVASKKFDGIDFDSVLQCLDD